MVARCSFVGSLLTIGAEGRWPTARLSTGGDMRAHIRLGLLPRVRAVLRGPLADLVADPDLAHAQDARRCREGRCADDLLDTLPAES